MTTLPNGLIHIKSLSELSLRHPHSKTKQKLISTCHSPDFGRPSLLIFFKNSVLYSAANCTVLQTVQCCKLYSAVNCTVYSVQCTGYHISLEQQSPATTAIMFIPQLKPSLSWGLTQGEPLGHALHPGHGIPAGQPPRAGGQGRQVSQLFI